VNGPHIKPGRIPIPELLVLCQHAQSAVNRQAEVLRGKRGLRPGPTATLVKDECTLELFAIGKGSAVMSFAGPESQPRPQGDLDLDMEKLGEAAVRKVIASIRNLKKKQTVPSMDIGVKRSLQEMGVLLSNGVRTIEWSTPGVRGKQRRMTAVFDSDTRDRINEVKPSASTRTIDIDGRLEMADFKLEDLKCIIHTPEGNRVTCSFTSDLEDDVYKALRHVARVTGDADINPTTKRPEHIALSTVRVLDPFFGNAGEFFSGLSVEQLTKAQGVDPAHDLRTLKNAWPENDDVEAFLAGVYQART
jgi:hypothetical protein